jgi:hypothetical protein
MQQMAVPNAHVLSWLLHRLAAVDMGRIALDYSMSWDSPPSLDIRFDGKQVFEGNAYGFTNAAIEAAIVHSRALLEFLGLGGMSQTKLKELRTGAKGRNFDDICVEQFADLTKLKISDALKACTCEAAEAEASLAYVIYLANKGLAHTTSTFSKHDQGSRLLEIAFWEIPALVINKFHVPLKIETPPYEHQARIRDE